MTEHHQEINWCYIFRFLKSVWLCALWTAVPRLKLKCHGIEGSLLRCFRSFPTDRKQRVVVRGTHLSWSCVTLDVPQGTILGPILFVIYVNDISSNISSTLRMFPDDTKVYRELSNIARDNEARYNLMSISYYPGHLNGNYALIPLNVRFYNAQTRPLPPYILVGYKP